MEDYDLRYGWLCSTSATNVRADNPIRPCHRLASSFNVFVGPWLRMPYLLWPQRASGTAPLLAFLISFRRPRSQRTPRIYYSLLNTTAAASSTTHLRVRVFCFSLWHHVRDGHYLRIPGGTLCPIFRRLRSSNLRGLRSFRPVIAVLRATVPGVAPRSEKRPALVASAVTRPRNVPPATTWPPCARALLRTAVRDQGVIRSKVRISQASTNGQRCPPGIHGV